MQYTAHQKRLWSDMIESIAHYRKGEIPFSTLVAQLEGALDAGEYQDKDLILQWYNFWTPLEILNATNGDNVALEDADNDLSAMELFLINRYDLRVDDD